MAITFPINPFNGQQFTEAGIPVTWQYDVGRNAWRVVRGGTPWTDIVGKPDEFPPSDHVHPIAEVTGLQTILDVKQDITARGVPDGYAPLDSTGKVPENMIPGSGVFDWDDIADKPTEFPPSAHSHPVAEINDSSSTGQQLVRAPNAAAARQTIGAIGQDENARVSVDKNGTLVGMRRTINFIEGQNITMTVADDVANEEVDVTINAASGPVDTAKYTVSEIKPAAPFDNQLWFDAATGLVFTYYNDGTSAQWIESIPFLASMPAAFNKFDFPGSPIDGTLYNPIPGATWKYSTTRGVWFAQTSVSDAYTKTESDAKYVDLVGDTMTGPLTLSAAPTAPLQAATKGYVDTADNSKVAKAGDTMTGPLTLFGMGHWIYSGSGAGSYYNTSTVTDRFFLGTDAGTDIFRLYSAGAASNVLSVDGATGLLTLKGDPASALHAVTKQYADTKLPLAGGTMTGGLITASSSGTIAAASGPAGTINVRGGPGAGHGSFMTFHNPTMFAVNFGLDSDNKLKVGGFSLGANAYEIWHAGNILPVSKTGDTMSGNLTVSKATPSVILDNTGDPGTHYDVIVLKEAGVLKWEIATWQPAAGDHAVNFDRYGPGGTYLDTALSISHTTGRVALNGDPSDPLHAATKQYVDANASGGGLVFNGSLAATVVGNALTVSLKTLTGADPSASSPVNIWFRSATPGTGSYVLRQVIAPMAFTVFAGSTLGTFSGTPGRVWVVIFDDAGTLRLGVINVLQFAGVTWNIFGLQDSGIASSTAEGGAGAADSPGTFYTQVAITNKAYRTLGSLTWNTGLATAGSWSALPNVIESVGPLTKLPGTVVQTTHCTSGGSTASAASFWTITNSALVLYPTAACNIIEIIYQGKVIVTAAGAGTNTNMAGVVTRNAAALGCSVGVGSVSGAGTNVQTEGAYNINLLDNPSTLAQVIYYANARSTTTVAAITISNLIGTAREIVA